VTGLAIKRGCSATSHLAVVRVSTDDENSKGCFGHSEIPFLCFEICASGLMCCVMQAPD
jgi:hypothetical protein